MTTTAGAANERLKWVGCLLVLGLVLALGFAGYRVWNELRREAPAVIALPSARPVAVPLPAADTALPVAPLPPIEPPPTTPDGSAAAVRTIAAGARSGSLARPSARRRSFVDESRLSLVWVVLTAP